MTAVTDRASAVLGFRAELARSYHLLGALAPTVHDDDDALEDTLPGEPGPDSDFTMTTQQPQKEHR